MKISLIIITLFALIGTASAGDVSCQGELMKPKIKVVAIQELPMTLSNLPVAEGHVETGINHNKGLTSNVAGLEQETVLAEEEDEADDEVVKKESRLGGIFEILLPSKLRNPARKL
ncbi:MAG: hypothetical protein ACSHWU_04185 [Marinicella sp.]